MEPKVNTWEVDNGSKNKIQYVAYAENPKN